MGEARRGWRIPLGVAVAFAALELVAAWIGPYGLHHDELYYWACANRPGLGYVDHPPLAPWILAAGMALFGEGRLVFILLPAACGIATIVLAGRIAGSLGAGSFGCGLAALAVAVMPVSLVMFSFYSVNAFEMLFWTLTTFLLVEQIRLGEDRLWLAIGLVAGVALLNKHTFLLLPAALAVGVVASSGGNELRNRRLWQGIAIAILLALPNIVWNAVHGWPSLEFYRSRPEVDLPATVLEALELQIEAANPANVLLWVPGALFLLLSRRARPYRPFGIAFLVLLAVILLSNQRRPDRIAGIYPVVLAAGAAFWDRWQGRRWSIRMVLGVLLLAGGALLAPVTLPLLRPTSFAEYLRALGREPPKIETADVGQSIPVYLSGRLEWKRLADEITEEWQALPPAEQERAVILAPHWVYASVIEYYGRERGLPPVVAPHNAYWFWREEARGRDAVLAVSIPPDVLSRYFREIRQVGLVRCEYCTSFRPDMPLVFAEDPVRPLAELLVDWRHFGIRSARWLRPG